MDRPLRDVSIRGDGSVGGQDIGPQYDLATETQHDWVTNMCYQGEDRDLPTIQTVFIILQAASPPLDFGPK